MAPDRHQFDEETATTAEYSQCCTDCSSSSSASRLAELFETGVSAKQQAPFFAHPVITIVITNVALSILICSRFFPAVVAWPFHCGACSPWLYISSVKVSDRHDAVTSQLQSQTAIPFICQSSVSKAKTINFLFGHRNTHTHADIGTVEKKQCNI